MTNILGPATIPLDTMTRFVAAHNAEPINLLIVRAYWTIAHKEYGLDPAACLAQAVHETGYFTSWWSTRANNFAGIGVTGQGWGYAFESREAGVRAHCAHLLGYTKTAHNQTCITTDPRHAAVTLPNGMHLGKIVTIADLNNAGWSIVSTDYGTKVQQIYDAMAKA